MPTLPWLEFKSDTAGIDAVGICDEFSHGISSPPNAKGLGANGGGQGAREKKVELVHAGGGFIERVSTHRGGDSWWNKKNLCQNMFQNTQGFKS